MILRATSLLAVDAIEPDLPLWQALGFHIAARVPPQGPAGFVLLQQDHAQVMLQTRDSLAADVPRIAGPASSGGLMVEVDNLDQALQDVPEDIEHAVPRRRTFYGADEVGLLTHSGHVVLLSALASSQAPVPRRQANDNTP